MELNSIFKEQNFAPEVIARFDFFIEELMLWSQKINLVSRKNGAVEISEFILDSAGLSDHIAKDDKVIDVGSGAGFPGLILAMMGHTDLHLVERNAKKSKFLSHIVKEMKLSAIVHNCDVREENFGSGRLNIVAKAVASCSDFASICYNTLLQNKKSRILLLKGPRLMSEVEEMAEYWSFKLQQHENKYKKSSVIAEIKDLRKKKR